MVKILILNLPGSVLKAGSRWYNTTNEKSASLKYHPYPWFMGYAASLLKKEGFNVLLKDAVALKWTFDDTINFIQKYNPEYIVCEPTWISDKDDKKLLDTVGENTVKIAVGNYATNYPYKCMKKSGVNYVAVGEYEFSLVEFFKSHGKYLPKNFISKEKKEYEMPDLVELNQFPWPERNDTPFEFYNEPSCCGKNIVMVSSRGCRLKCSFCNVECIYGKHAYRTRSPKSVVDEMEYLREHYDFDEIYFDDDNMVARKDHIDGICKEIVKRGLKIKWLCMGDGLVDDETLELLAKAGCVTYKYGLEHLDKEVLRAIPKPLTRERSLEIIKKCRQLGMRSYVNLMVGLPRSTWKKDLKMLEDVISANPDLIQIAITIPYPGTVLYGKAKENGWLISENPSYFDATNKGPLSYPNYSAEKIKEMFHLGWKMWYKHVLFHQPKTLWFFISSEMKRNGFFNTARKSIAYFLKIIKNEH